MLVRDMLGHISSDTTVTIMTADGLEVVTAAKSEINPERFDLSVVADFRIGDHVVITLREDSFGARKRIHSMMKLRGKTLNYVSEGTGLSYHTVRNKVLRDNMAYNYVEQVADLLGFDIVFRDRIEGKEV